MKTWDFKHTRQSVVQKVQVIQNNEGFS